uniref:Secreted protein n=1 Tax=Echinococcus granulosus TaxID=6210 RepID=A0A068X0T2_ECHGR|nr:hypothetical protein EgrG_002042000 [Echinococcus granulosus]
MTSLPLFDSLFHFDGGLSCDAGMYAFAVLRSSVPSDSLSLSSSSEMLKVVPLFVFLLHLSLCGECFWYEHKQSVHSPSPTFPRSILPCPPLDVRYIVFECYHVHSPWPGVANTLDGGVGGRVLPALTALRRRPQCCQAF